MTLRNRQYREKIQPLRKNLFNTLKNDFRRFGNSMTKTFKLYLKAAAR